MILHNLVQSQLNHESCTGNVLRGRSALQIKHDARIRLETLMRLWYLRHSFRTYDSWALMFLVYLGNLAIESLNEIPKDEVTEPSLAAFRSTIVLSINGSNSQSHLYYFGALISRSMIERLSPEDAEHLRPHFTQSAESEVEGPFDSEVRSPRLHQQGCEPCSADTAML